MTRAEMLSMLKADFLGFDGLSDLTYTDKTTASGTAYTVNNARQTFQTVQGFGEPLIRGYTVSSVGLTFPVDELAVSCKLGDTFVYESQTYEVTEAALKTASTRWQVTGSRAGIDTDFATTCDIQRATLTVNSAGAAVETNADTTASVSVIVVNNDDVADMISRLGVRGDKQSLNFYMAQSVTVSPTDRIEYSSRFYRITSIQDEGRVARLKRVVAEIYP